MTSLAELDFFDCCWLILFLLVVGPLTFLGTVIVSGNAIATGLLITLLLLAAGLLLKGLQRWSSSWMARLLLTLATTSTWYLAACVVWGYFRNFC